MIEYCSIELRCSVSTICRTNQDDAVVESFPDLHGYSSGLSPSTFVVVRRNKKKRNKPYEYPQILYPNHSHPISNTTATIMTDDNVRTNYTTNTRVPAIPTQSPVVSTQETHTNSQIVSSRTTNPTIDYNRPDVISSSSATTMGRQPSSPSSTQVYRTPVFTHRYQPEQRSSINWQSPGATMSHQSIGYIPERPATYLQHDVHFSPRLNPIERKQEPHVLHYYTGYDYFSTTDPADSVLKGNDLPLPRSGLATRYTVNPPYNESNDYLKSFI
jgi:hypothetical protein